MRPVRAWLTRSSSPCTCCERAANGKLFLADTRQVFLIDVEKALASGTSAGASKAVKITGELRGSYATFDGKDAGIGKWGKLYRLDRQGNVKAEYEMVAGLEDLTVDESGRL